MFRMEIMNKKFFIISIVIYILNYLAINIFDINAHNSLWSGISFIILLIPLSIGCIINSIIYNKRIHHLDIPILLFSFMCSLGIY